MQNRLKAVMSIMVHDAKMPESDTDTETRSCKCAQAGCVLAISGYVWQS